MQRSQSNPKNKVNFNDLTVKSGPGILFDMDEIKNPKTLGLHITSDKVIMSEARPGREVRKVVESVALDRLLVETDSPYLTPLGQRHSRNEPAFVRKVAEKVAEIKQVTLEEVSATTTANATRIFGVVIDGE